MDLNQLLAPASTNETAHQLATAAAEFWDHPIEFVRRLSEADLPQRREVRTVAVFFPTVGIGGGERMTQFLVKLWQAHGYRVVLVTEDELPPAQRAIIPDVTCRQVPTYLECTPATYEGRATALAEILVDENVDALVFAHWFSPTMPFDLALARLLAVRPYVFIQSSFALFYTDPYLGAPYQRVPPSYALAEALVCLSSTDGLYWSAFNANVYVAPNPLSFSFPEEPAPLEGHTVLWPHRVHPDKEPERAVRVLAELVKVVPDARVRMIGPVDESCLESVLALAEDLQVTGHLDVVGPVPPTQMAAEYASADAFLLTSSQEGFALTVQEAMAAGVPVVLYELPHLTLCECGAVCQVPPDDAGAAAMALADRLTDKDAARAIGAEERAFVRQLMDFDYASLWEHLFRDGKDTSRFDPDPSELSRLSSLMVRELVRAHALGTERRTVNEHERTAALRKELRLTHQHADNLQGMLNYQAAETRAAEARAETLAEQVDALASSVSLHVGRIVTFLPRAACRAINNIGERRS